MDSLAPRTVELTESVAAVYAEAVALCIQRHAYSPEVLAVQRREDVGVIDPPRLCMPGGRIEREHPRVAGCREALEETGIVLAPKALRWCGAVQVESRGGGMIAVAVYLVLAPFCYEPGPGMGEPLMAPRWHPLDDLCDPRHGRFAGPATLARMVLRG